MYIHAFFQLPLEPQNSNCGIVSKFYLFSVIIWIIHPDIYTCIFFQGYVGKEKIIKYISYIHVSIILGERDHKNPRPFLDNILENFQE